MKPKFQDTQKIKVLAKSNPKSGASAKRFKLYKTGMTVKAALAKGVWRGDLIWDTKHGYIRIS
jgi:hypothetical protein